MAYLTRMGLWGPGTAFNDFNAFLDRCAASVPATACYPAPGDAPTHPCLVGIRTPWVGTCTMSHRPIAHATPAA